MKAQVASRSKAERMLLRTIVPVLSLTALANGCVSMVAEYKAFENSELAIEYDGDVPYARIVQGGKLVLLIHYYSRKDGVGARTDSGEAERVYIEIPRSARTNSVIDLGKSDVKACYVASRGMQDVHRPGTNIQGWVRLLDRSQMLLDIDFEIHVIGPNNHLIKTVKGRQSFTKEEL